MMKHTHQRSQSSTSSKRPSISNPISADRFVPLSPPRTKSPPPAAATSPPRSRSALAGSMARSWLSRASSSGSSSSTPYAPSKPVRISEPKLSSTFDPFTSPQRSGFLGSGAIVVRTPQEALAGTNVSMYDIEPRAQSPLRSEDRYEQPMSPPLPPIPDFEDDEEQESEPEVKEEVEQVTPSRSSTPSRPTRAPPPVPVEDSVSTSPPMTARRSSLKSSPRNSELFPPVPALPANIPLSPPQPPFDAILLTPIPTGSIDPAKVIITLETCTATYRTTLQTLTSRPSYLSTYLKSLLPAQEQDDDDVSIRDDDSAFNSIFHHHLTSSGLLSQTSSNIHIFLDRPSAPYAHILAYLRTLPSTPEHPAILPRPVQLTSTSSSRLDALLELRDEAKYLDLDELYKLCTDELRLRQSDDRRNNALGFHTRVMSNASSVSGRSLGTLRENVEHGTESHELGEKTVKHTRNRSKDSGLGSGSPRSGPKALSPRNSDPHSDTWNSSPPVMANASALKQRLQMNSRGRKQSPVPRPVGRWV